MEDRSKRKRRKGWQCERIVGSWASKTVEKGCKQLPEAKKGKGMTVPKSQNREHSPANTLVLEQGDPFQTSDLHDLQIINLWSSSY